MSNFSFAFKKDNPHLFSKGYVSLCTLLKKGCVFKVFSQFYISTTRETELIVKIINRKYLHLPE